MSGRKFPWTRTFVLGFGFLGISIIWPIFNQYLPIFLQAGNEEYNKQLLAEGSKIPEVWGFALTPALAMFVMTWDNIINIFVQPWVGARSDRTWNRFGRRKIWILVGAPIAALGFVFIPVAQSLIAVMVFILITNFGMALFRSPTVAWLGDLFTPQERSKANGVINLMGGVGGLLAYFVGGMLFKSVGRGAPFIAGSLAMLAALAVAVIYVREPKNITVEAPKVKTNVLQNFKTVATNPEKSGIFVLLGILLWFMAFNALETGLSSFAVFTLKIDPGTASIYAASVTISFLAFSVPSGLIAQRIGRRRTIQIGLTGLTLMFLLAFFIVQNVPTLLAVLVVVGFFWSLVNVNSLPLVYDYGEESKIGAYTGMYYFSSQLAAVLGPTLGGLMVDVLGDQYRWLFIFSTVFMALAWLAMTQVKERILPENR
jgi:maltose/moltooligosaccharide transporter